MNWIDRVRWDDSEAGLRVWVESLIDYEQQFNDLPPVEAMGTITASRFQTLSGLESVVAVGDCSAAYSLYCAWLPLADKKEIEARGRELLVEFLSLATARSAQRDLERSPSHAHEIFDNSSRLLTQIAGLDGSRFATAFPEGDFPRDVDVACDPVGIDFIDKMCGGGLLDGEVVGHAAPVGQGKTTLVLQLGWARAQQRYSRAIAERGPLGVDLAKLPICYIVAFENVRTLLASFVSNAANIPRNTCLTAMLGTSSQSVMSSRANNDYRDYELKMFRSQFEKADGDPKLLPPGEFDRFQEVTRLVTHCIEIVDFSGHNPKLADWAEQGVRGVAEYIRAHQESRGNPGVNFVALDFVGAMADVAIAAGRLKNQDLTNYIKRAPMELSRLVGAPFRCPVWAAHQLNPEENKRGGGTVPDPKRTSGSGMFLEYCAVGIASGMLTSENVAVYVLGKQRRVQASAAEKQIGRLSSMFARWENAARDFAISDGVVVPRSELAGSLSGGGAAKIPPMRGFGN